MDLKNRKISSDDTFTTTNNLFEAKNFSFVDIKNNFVLLQN